VIMDAQEFVVHAQIDAEALNEWVEAGWIIPRRDGRRRRFSEIDLARAHLIRDLQSLGVNDEGIPVILDLIDQLHGLRRILRHVISSVETRELE